MLIISCENSIKSDLEKFQIGKYLYSAFDTSGHELANGRIELNFDNGNSLKGIWNLSPTKTLYENHPHVGIGNLIGSFNNDTIWVNLHPGWADHNVILKGVYENGQINGSWEYISFVGWTDGGDFEAEYVENED